MRFNIGGGSNGSSPNMIVLTLFMIGGLVLLGYGFNQYQGQKASIDNAVNISATVADTNVRTDSSRRGSTDYQAEIDFNYSFEGEDYTSGFIYPLDDDREFSTEEEAQEFLQSYSAGTEVDAYVSPETPDEAFLNNESSDQPLIFLLIGGLMTLSAGYKTVKNIV